MSSTFLSNVIRQHCTSFTYIFLLLLLSFKDKIQSSVTKFPMFPRYKKSANPTDKEFYLKRYYFISLADGNLKINSICWKFPRKAKYRGRVNNVWRVRKLSSRSTGTRRFPLHENVVIKFHTEYNAMPCRRKVEYDDRSRAQSTASDFLRSPFQSETTDRLTNPLRFVSLNARHNYISHLLIDWNRRQEECARTAAKWKLYLKLTLADP